LGLVVAWAWVHVSLSNTQIASDTRADEVGDVGMVDWNDIGFVFSWARLIHVFACKSLQLVSHVELGFLECFFEVSLEDVFAWAWHIACLYQVMAQLLAEGLPVEMVGLVVIWVIGIVFLRTHWLFGLVHFFCALAFGKLDSESGRLVNWEVVIVAWPWLVVRLLYFFVDGASEH
jgi:hypothetical protein